MGKKGGRETTTTEIKLHPEIEQAALQNIQLANDVAAMGAMPYRGPTVAGFSPQQINAMASYDQAAGAFGMPNQGTQGMSGNALYTALTGMPPPQQFAGGISGYSGMGLADQQYANLPPAQRAMLESFLMDPVTGAQPTNPNVPRIARPTVNPQDGRTPEERLAIQRANAERLRREQEAAALAASRSPARRRHPIFGDNYRDLGIGRGHSKN